MTSTYVSSRCRIASGRESLALQSIHYGRDRQEWLGEFNDTLLRDLAGNAWEFSCACAMVLAQEVVLGLLAARAKSAKQSIEKLDTTAASSSGMQRSGRSRSLMFSGSGTEQASAAIPGPGFSRLTTLDLDFSGGDGEDARPAEYLESFLQWHR